MLISNSDKAEPSATEIAGSVKKMTGYFVNGQWHVVLDIKDSVAFNNRDVTHLMRSMQVIQRRYVGLHRRAAVAAQHKQEMEYQKSVSEQLRKESVVTQPKPAT